MAVDVEGRVDLASAGTSIRALRSAIRCGRNSYLYRDLQNAVSAQSHWL
jgi:hypothetical protein